MIRSKISYKHYRSKILIFGAILLLFFLLSFSSKTQPIFAFDDWTYPSGFDPHGPYIDQLWWLSYTDEEIFHALLALQRGDVSGFDGNVPFASAIDLSTTPGVEVSFDLAYSFDHFILNCQRFPTNITAYRRALAYALDKYDVIAAATGGDASPLDGVIPIPNVLFCFENQFTDHFYQKDIIKANACLDAAKFRDLDGDGWREYDTNNNSLWDFGLDLDDEDLEIEIIVPVNYYFSGAQSASILSSGMREAGLPGVIVEAAYDHMIDALRMGNFWLSFRELDLELPGDPSLLYDYFYSNSEHNQLHSRYNCTEYDYNVTRMMLAPTYLEARNWAWNCSQLLIRDLPVITCYNDILIQAYRTDIWDGYVNMNGLGRMGNNPWTHRKLHLTAENGGPWGFTYPVAYHEVLTNGMADTNVILVNGGSTDEVFMNLYSHLWAIDPTGLNRVPDLAYNWTIEPTIASGDIQNGQKIRFLLYENVSWHDGTPFTSNDVKYSLETIWPSSPHAAQSVANIYRIDIPDNYTVEIYSNKTGYFEFANATYHYILPKHIWEAHPNVTDWVPLAADDLVGTGPFRWITQAPAEYIVLSRFDKYHFGLEAPIRPTQTNWAQIGLGILVTICVIVIIIEIRILHYLIYRHKRDTKKE